MINMGIFIQSGLHIPAQAYCWCEVRLPLHIQGFMAGPRSPSLYVPELDSAAGSLRPTATVMEQKPPNRYYGHIQRACTLCGRLHDPHHFLWKKEKHCLMCSTSLPIIDAVKAVQWSAQGTHLLCRFHDGFDLPLAMASGDGETPDTWSEASDISHDGRWRAELVGFELRIIRHQGYPGAPD